MINNKAVYLFVIMCTFSVLSLYIQQMCFFFFCAAALKNACHENNTARDFASQPWNKYAAAPLLLSQLKSLCYVLTSTPNPLSWTRLTQGQDTDGYQRACPKTWPRHMVAWQGSKVTSVKYGSKTSSVLTDMQPEGGKRQVFISVEPGTCTWIWGSNNLARSTFLCLHALRQLFYSLYHRKVTNSLLRSKCTTLKIPDPFIYSTKFSVIFQQLLMRYTLLTVHARLKTTLAIYCTLNCCHASCTGLYESIHLNCRWYAVFA